MIEPPAFRVLDKAPPGIAAAWSLTLSPSDPRVTAALRLQPSFLGMLPSPGAQSPPLMTFGQGTHHARIDADAQIGLAAGSCSITLLRAHPEDFARLTAAKAACDAGGTVDLVAELSLGWAGTLTKVGTFAVTAVAPAVEGVAYSITLQAREWIAHRLSRRRVTRTDSYATPEDALAALLQQTGFPATEYTAPPDPTLPPLPEMPPLSLTVGVDALAEAQRLGQMCESSHRREGRKALLVRNGVLHIGVGRPIPFRGGGADGKTIRISAANGLIAQAETQSQQRDPRFEFAEAFARRDFNAQPEMRRGFRLTLVGAPEIQPGDVVQFPLAAPLATASIDDLSPAPDWSRAPELHVDTVNHRIERDVGFVTILTGVEVETTGGRPTSIWDVPSPAPGEPVRPSHAQLDDGTPEGALTAAVQTRIDHARGHLAPPQVAEVVETAPAIYSGDDRLPLSSDVIVNLSSPDGARRSAVTGEMFRRNPSPLDNVPYATPFAWGPFGLVVPRYPGMRVLLVHPRGDREDPVDVGALWHGASRNEDGRPAQALAGDWWLSLPARVDAASREEAVQAPVLPPGDALAANDLTDAQGNRVIEVGQLVIRVGDAALGQAGERPHPDDAPAGAIVIEQKDGEARITMDQDGTVTIKANNVAVEVSGTMDVRKA